MHSQKLAAGHPPGGHARARESYARRAIYRICYVTLALARRAPKLNDDSDSRPKTIGSVTATLPSAPLGITSYLIGMQNASG
eukprot:SAG31_NODE_34701_length_330_cov_0.883117_1_plen_81_part_01